MPRPGCHVALKGLRRRSAGRSRHHQPVRDVEHPPEGPVISGLHRRHRTVEFSKILAKIDAEVRDHLEVHPVCDNYRTHKTPTVTTWLERATHGRSCT